MRQKAALVAGLLVAMLSPRAATAVLTTRVGGLEPALNDAWKSGPTCDALQVEDLAFREGSFALLTTGPLIFRLSREDRGATICSAGSWHVSPWERGEALSAACGPDVCRVLTAHPEFGAALDASFAKAGAGEESPIPLTWSTPGPKGLSLLWFIACLTTLALLLVLPLATRWTNRARGPATLKLADWIVILALAAGGLGLRAVVARRAMVELDETVSVGYDSLWREFDGRETVMNPPLYRVISYPLTLRTKGAAVAGRAVPVLLGFVLVVILGWVGGLIGGRRSAWAAATLGAVHPWLVMATVYHRSYAPLVVTTALSIGAVLVALRSERAIQRYIVAVCLAATFLSHYSGAAIVASAAVWILFADARRWRLWIGPFALTTMLCAPYVPAALSGAHAKQFSPIGTAGASHAWQLALSMMSVIGGVVQPRLETPIYLEQSHRTLVTGAVLVGVLLLLATWRAGRSLGGGLLLLTVAGAALPVAIAFRLTTVREFQGVEAAVPAVLLIAALFAPGRPRWILPIATVVLLALVSRMVSVLPFDVALQTRVDAISQTIRDRAADGPFFIWGNGSPNFSDIALGLGVSRPVADASYDGRDPKIRALRSCSSAAVREASRSSRAMVTVLSIDADCGREELSGRDVSCQPTQPNPAGFTTTVCQVDQAGAPPAATLPSRMPASLRRRVDRAIPSGHEALFTSACAPFELGKDDGHGHTVTGISIGMEYAQYRVKTATGLSFAVLASPHFEDEEVRGTDLLVDPPIDALPAESRAVATRLKDALAAHLTTAVWNDVYGLVTNGAGGHAPVKPLPWLVLTLLSGLVLVVALIQGRRKAIVRH
jgi:hypothetical protein